MRKSVKPGFMGDPSESVLSPGGTKIHSYQMPENGEDIIEAIQWMMSVYDDVVCEYGAVYDCPYCVLEGNVRNAPAYIRELL